MEGHLKQQRLLTSSRWADRRGGVTLVTQLSMDRLDRLQAQCASWAGTVCAAVYCPLLRCQTRLARAEAVRDSIAKVKACMATAEAGGAFLAVAVMSEQVSCLQRAREEYPVNALRNAALSIAETDLVLLLDVDFLVSSGSAARWASEDAAGALWQSCCARCELLVLPAFQVATSAEADAAVSGGKAGVRAGVEAGWLTQFAAAEFPQGHRATEYSRWLGQRSQYMVDYEEGFEPFVIAPRRLVPWYDPRFRGYGRNKVSHLLHCAALGMRFAVLPEDWVVHRPHSPSCAFKCARRPQSLTNHHYAPLLVSLLR